MKKLIKILFTLAMACMSTSWAVQSEPIQVWGVAVSPYVRKVISVLEEKRLDYEVQPILPTFLLEATHQPVPEKFREISPLGKIPVIEVGSFHLADSSVIVAYLERKWPSSFTVYPTNSEDLARALWFEKYADTAMTEVFHSLLVEKLVKPNLLKQEADEQAIAKLFERMPLILQYLEKELAKNQTPYLVGHHLTIADIAVIHHFASLQLIQVELNLENYPSLKEYIKRTLHHPSIQAAIKKV